MIIDEKVYIFPNGNMRLLSKTRYTYKINEIEKKLKKWYALHPYSKKINEKVFCGDYRIDQQRPQRNVYSEVYWKIISISEMEKKVLNETVKKIESNIDYPTVWDDGENRYYEDTIHCPKCGKRRKVLTSKTHCEFCGFEFDNAKKCPKCKDLSLKNSNHCNHCGHDFNEKQIEKNIVEKEEIIRCPKCGEVKLKENDYCRKCNFNFNDKKRCVKCNTYVDDEDKFCYNCGQKLVVLKKCTCGKKNEIGKNYCSGCGKKL